MAHRILIVEDEPLVQRLMAMNLENAGYEVATAASAEAMYKVFDRERVDLVLLDLGLPDEDGIALVRQIRTRSQVPIIVLTARTGLEDRLAALELGADDYLTKGADPREILLRVKNTLARAASHSVEGMAADDRIRFLGWTLDPKARSLIGPDGADAHLTQSEFNLLLSLALAPNRVLSRDQLLDAVSRHGETPSDRMIDAFVSRVRRKMKDGRFVVTVPGIGYKFDPDPS